MEIKSVDEFYKIQGISKLEYCYNLCSSVGFVKRKIVEYAEFYGCTGETIYVNAKKYAFNVLNMSKEDFMKLVPFHGPKYVILIEKLIETKDPQEINRLLSDKEINLGFLWDKIKCFARIHRKELSLAEQNAITSDLIKKVRGKIVLDKATKQKEIELRRMQQEYEKDRECLEQFKGIILNLSDNEEELEAFKKSLKYKRALELLKEAEPNMYEEYKAQQAKKEEMFNAVLLGKFKKLSNFIKNGVERNVNTEEFDIVSVYEEKEFEGYIELMLGKVRVCDGKLPVSDITAIQRLLRYTRENLLTDFQIKNLIEGTNMINCEKDEKGMVIPNSGEVIPREEKEAWINYLNEKNIPITHGSYNAMLERYKRKAKAKRM